MDHITRVRVRNVRAIRSLDLELGRPLTVLIGENGSGKSTLVECLQLLRLAAETSFTRHFFDEHRGLVGLLRAGESSMGLGVVIEDDAGVEPTLDYQIVLSRERTHIEISLERLLVGPTATLNAGVQDEAEAADLEARGTERRSAARTRASAVPARGARLSKEHIAVVAQGVLEAQALIERAEQLRRGMGAKAAVPLVALERSGFDGKRVGASALLISAHTSDSSQLIAPGVTDVVPGDAFRRLNGALRGIEVHIGFDTLATWANRTYRRPETVRGPATLFPAERLQLRATNLASCWAELRNQSHARWTETLDLVRLGLGDRLDTVSVPPDGGGGSVYLAVKFHDLPHAVLASDLSDGQLAWLAFVAMARLNPSRSLLVVDEPELHLHPALLGRVVALLANLEGGARALVSTHSDRVLEMLDDPVDAVRVCQLDDGVASVARIDGAELPGWLEQFGDVGQLRAAGYLGRVLVPAEPVAVNRGEETK